MTATPFNVGAYVLGAPTTPRVLVRHADLLTAYDGGDMVEKGENREAYLSHFAFGAEMQTHYATNRNSVAGFAGPCWCRWLILDIDRPDLVDALTDARRLVAYLRQRYGTEDVPVWFSGSKGFHVAVELAHNPPPAVGFHRTARTLAEGIAHAAGVVIDTSVYDIAHIIRLPNTRHPRTGLFKRLIDPDALFRLDIDGIRQHAKHPAGDGIPALKATPPQLVTDWHEAEAATARTTEARTVIRRDSGPDIRAPRYFVDFLRFGVGEGVRNTTLFRCAAWMAEQGAPPALVAALLTEPGCDIGLSPRDVARQIQCGIDHARRQRGTDPDAYERWAIEHEADPLSPGALDFPFGQAEGGAA